MGANVPFQNKCHATRNRCLTSSNKKLLETSASLVVTSASLVVTSALLVVITCLVLGDVIWSDVLREHTAVGERPLCRSATFRRSVDIGVMAPKKDMLKYLRFRN